jgi:hypothetical protein
MAVRENELHVLDEDVSDNSGSLFNEDETPKTILDQVLKVAGTPVDQKVLDEIYAEQAVYQEICNHISAAIEELHAAVSGFLDLRMSFSDKLENSTDKTVDRYTALYAEAIGVNTTALKIAQESLHAAADAPIYNANFTTRLFLELLLGKEKAMEAWTKWRESVDPFSQLLAQLRGEIPGDDIIDDIVGEEAVDLTSFDPSIVPERGKGN